MYILLLLLRMSLVFDVAVTVVLFLFFLLLVVVGCCWLLLVVVGRLSLVVNLIRNTDNDSVDSLGHANLAPQPGGVCEPEG